MKRKLVVVLIVSIIAAMTLSGCSILKKNEAQIELDDKPVAVEVKRVEKRDVFSKLLLNGRVKPAQEIIIVPKLPGKVAKVNFDIGQTVKKGDVLFVMDEKDIKLQVAQAQAGLNVAKANLDRAKGSASEQQLEQLRVALKGAEAGYKAAKEAYENTQQLYNTGAVQKDIMDKAEAQYKAAEQQYSSAKTSLEFAENKAVPETVAIAEAQYKQALAAYNIARAQLDNVEIVSPINGIVSVRSIDAGELASSAAIAMSVVDISEVTIDVNVTEAIINRISAGDKVSVNIPSIDKVFDGEIITISPSADARLLSYPVKIKLTNLQGVLKGGMFAEVEFILAKAENVIVTPLNAIIDEQGKKSVFIIVDGKAVKREVKTGIQDDDYIEILNGLLENEDLVVKGQDFLQDEAKVTIKE